MVSIVVPVYNSERAIVSCLDALFSQSIKGGVEIIVVNDGSTDETTRVLEGFINQIRILDQEHKGPATARNAGVKVARGEIIVFMDADCIPAENWLAEMLKPFENKEVVGVQGAYKTTQKGLTAMFSQIEFEERYQLMESYQYVDLVATYSAAFRREIFKKVGLFDETFPVPDNEDVELSFRITEKGKRLVFNPRALVYHKHRDTPLAYFQMKLSRGFWRMKVYQRYPGKILKDTYTPKSLKLQFVFGFISLLCLIGVNFFSISLIFFFAFIGCYLFSMWPLFWLSFKLNPALFAVIPFFVSLRALALVSGSCLFVIKQGLFTPLREPRT